MYRFSSSKLPEKIPLTGYKPPAIRWVINEVGGLFDVTMICGHDAYSARVQKAGKSIAATIKEGRKMIREMRATRG